MPARDVQIRDAMVSWLNDAANQANFPQTFTASGVWDTGYALESLKDASYYCQVFLIPSLTAETAARRLTATEFIVALQFYKKYQPETSLTRAAQGDAVAELRDVVRTYLEPNETNDETPPSMSGAYWSGIDDLDLFDQVLSRELQVFSTVVRYIYTDAR